MSDEVHKPVKFIRVFKEHDLYVSLGLSHDEAIRAACAALAVSGVLLSTRDDVSAIPMPGAKHWQVRILETIEVPLQELNLSEDHDGQW